MVSALSLNLSRPVNLLPRCLNRVLAVVMLVVSMAWVAPAGAHDRPDSFSKLAKGLSPAVVNISTITTLDGDERNQFPQFPPGSPFEDFFEEFRNRSPRQTQAVGSGFIIDDEGIVVTNNHVIETADTIRVILHNEKIFEAELLGRDPKTDIAVLRIDPGSENLQAVNFGNSDKVSVGDWVMAIGNPFGLGGTVTAGIVSARGRDIGNGPYDDFIQTDASINRGNSGGPLFNLDGEVIGINTAIFSQSGGSVGIGFAISSNLATNVVGQLVELGRTRRGWLGVFIQDVTPEIAESLGLKSEKGALVSSVHQGGPAESGGIVSGDIIIRFDGKAIDDTRSLPRIVAETEVDKTVQVEILRDGKRQTIEIKLGELEQAEKDGRLAGADVSPQNFGTLGFTVGPINEATIRQYNLPKTVNGAPITGVVVTEVAPGGPAAERGIGVGDVIRRVGQHQVNDKSDLTKGVEEAKANGKTSLLLLVRTGDRERFIPMPID